MKQTKEQVLVKLANTEDQLNKVHAELTREKAELSIENKALHERIRKLEESLTLIATEYGQLVTTTLLKGCGIEETTKRRRR